MIYGLVHLILVWCLLCWHAIGVFYLVFSIHKLGTISEPHLKSISCFIWKIVRRLIKSMPAPSVTNISYDLNKFYEHTFYCLWRECLVNIICSQLLDIPAHVHTYIVYVPSSSTVLISTCDSIQSLNSTVSSPWSCHSFTTLTTDMTNDQ